MLKIKEKFKQVNLEKLSIHLTTSTGVLWLFTLLFNYLDILPSYLSTKLFFVLFITSGVFYFSQKINKIPEAVRDKSSMIYYFLHFFLLSLIVIALNQFLKRQFIIDFMPEITAISIALGFLTFYAHKNKVEKEIEDEKDKEEEAEKKRYNEFEGKFPRLNKIPVLRNIVKWMHKEGWWYSGGLVAIVVIAGIIGFFVINNMIVTIDEGYTLNSINAYNEFGKLNLAESGASYERGGIYLFVVSLIYPLFNNILVGLRFFNLILYSLIIILVYFIAKSILKNKDIALLSSFLIGINWFFMTIVLTARNYSFSIVLFGIMLLLGFNLGYNKKRDLIIYVSLFVLLLLNYFEGFLIYSLHLLIFLGILLLIEKRISLKKIFLFGSLVLLSSFFLWFTFKSSLLFILETFQIDFSRIYWEAIVFNGSIFSYIPILGLFLLFCSMIFCLINFENKKVLLLVLFPIFTILIQVFLFTSRRSYPRYLADLIIPLIIIISIFTYYLFKKKQRILPLLIILIIVSTSILNISLILNQELGYSYYQPNNFEEAINNIPENAIIITDMPNTVKIFRSSQEIYALRDNPLDGELVYLNGTHYNFLVQNKDPKFQNKDQIDYFKNIQLENYTLENEKTQLYLYYDKTPKIMSIKQLLEISKKGEIYFILTHNAFENKNKKDNYELRNFVDENSKLIYGGEIQENFAFDSREFDITINNPRKISVLKFNN